MERSQEDCLDTVSKNTKSTLGHANKAQSTLGRRAPISVELCNAVIPCKLLPMVRILLLWCHTSGNKEEHSSSSFSESSSKMKSSAVSLEEEAVRRGGTSLRWQIKASLLSDIGGFGFVKVVVEVVVLVEVVVALKARSDGWVEGIGQRNGSKRLAGSDGGEEPTKTRRKKQFNKRVAKFCEKQMNQ